MAIKNTKSEFEIVSNIISLLENLEKEKQIHILTTVSTWLKIYGESKSSSEIKKRPVLPGYGSMGDTSKKIPKFSDRKEMTPKQFMLEKQPRTDIERLACLAYYLTYYRGMSQFRTVDLSKLNTEAAQRKFTNASETAKNASKMRYFVPASKKGNRQLSADGEQIIAALPDREAAAAIRKRMRPRKTSKRSKRRKTKFPSIK